MKAKRASTRQKCGPAPDNSQLVTVEYKTWSTLMATSTEDRPPTIDERYRSAVNTSSLASDPRSFRSPSDVLGAYGLADKHLTEGWVPTGPGGQGYDIREAPLAVPLARLLAGDSKVARDLVQILAGMVWSRAEFDRIKPKLTRPAAHDLACACLAWHRSGTCRKCGGHGYAIIPGTKTLSERECDHCRGVGKIPFEAKFIEPHQTMAKWLVGEMERAMGRAGQAAMAAIAPRLEM
jgi:hypothetical protein